MTTKRRRSASKIPKAEPRQSLTRLVLVVACFIAAAPAIGAEDQGSQEQAAPAPPAPASPHSGDLSERDVLTGDWGGLRTKLEDQGVILGADTIDEVFGNPVGGVKQGAIYDGRLQLLATLDLGKLAGWSDATLHADAYQIRGRGLSANYLDGNLLTVSDIEASRAFRLSTLWVEQILFQGKASLRVGQIAADDEFFISQNSAIFINSTSGWPAIMGSDLPSGGPAYPLGTPGVRIKVASDKVTMLAAVFDGNPTGPGQGNPQLRDPSGTAFRLSDGPFAIAEIGYAINQEKDAEGLPASYKLGAWYLNGAVADQRFDTTGQSLAAPTSSGIPFKRQGDEGIYAVIDQGVWRDSEVKGRSAAVFLRLAGAPSDRNLVSFYADAGVTLQGPFKGRGDDVAGLAFAVARIGDRARELDGDTRHFTGVDIPIRNAEAAIEFTYRAQVTPWWALQPDLQVVVNPGGNVPLPGDPTHAVGTALVIGLRSAIVF
jgi:porin